MTKLPGIIILLLCAIIAAPGQAAGNRLPQLPEWQVLEFEEQAYWATANSRLEIIADADDEHLWELDVMSSVLSNSEHIRLRFDPASGQTHSGFRISRGSGQRMKSYQYEKGFVLRERRDPTGDANLPAQKWPVTSRKKVLYPALATDTVVTNSYLLVLLAQRLQAQGSGKSQTVLVHTDTNFYRVRLSSGNGMAMNIGYQVSDQGNVSGERETLAVAVLVSPVGTQEGKSDFSLLGLEENIILYFDRQSGLPLQIRGVAPRIGATEINLKSVTMRKSTP